MSVDSSSTDLAVADDTDHQVDQEEPADQSENAIQPVLTLGRANPLLLIVEAPIASEEPSPQRLTEPQPKDATPFISDDTSPFEQDEAVLLDEWIVSRLYETEAEARVGLNRLFAQTGINFAYGLKINKHPFYIGDYHYFRYSFSARVGLYAFSDSLDGENADPDLADTLHSVEDELTHQLSVHHASRTLDLSQKRTFEVGHFTLMSITAGLALCVAFHGIMNGWLLGA